MKRRLDSPIVMAVNLVALIATIGLVAGFGYYLRDKQDIADKQRQTLAAVNAVKSDWVQRWRKGRLTLAQKAAKDRLLVKSVREYLAAPQNPELQKELQRSFADEIVDENKVEGLLFDTNAHLLVHFDQEPQGAHSNSDATLRAVQVATAIRNSEGDPLAVLVVRHNLEGFLFPMLAIWPTTSRSGETFIAQRDGDDVVYLSNLRDKRYPPLALRKSLTETDTPIVQAALGRTGTTEGTDYRGVRVLSDVRPIPDSPWFINSKMDTEEVYADARSHAILIGLIVGLFILLSASIVAIFYRRRQANILKSLIEAERSEIAALEAAQKAVEKHLDIIQTALDGFLVFDRKGVIKEVNSSYCRITGYSPDELLAMHISDLATTLSSEEVAARMQRVIALGSDRFETIHRRKYGTLINLDASVQFRPTEENFVAFVRDITQQKSDQLQLERITRLYSALSECNEVIVRSETLHHLYSEICRILVEHGGMTMVGIMMPDKETGTTGCVASFGQGKEYLMNLDFSLKTDIPSGLGPIATALHEHRPVWIQDFQHDPMTSPWHEPGKRFGWKSSAAIPLGPKEKPLGVITLYSGKIGEFDERACDLLSKIGEDVCLAMENFSMNAERKIMEDNLCDALNRSELASRAKSEFLAVMSHELRTPLNGVLGFAELLTTTPLNEEQLDYVKLIQSSGTHLLNIVSEILDFSSLEKGKIKLDSAELSTADLVEASYQTTRKVADDKGLDFRYEIASDVPTTITGDIQRLRQILINLLGNSLKFTESGSVLLRVSVSQEGDKRFLDFAVKDTGPGIAADKLDLLFKPFSQVDSSLSRKFQGTGLGLAICKRLSEAMGGTIIVESVLNLGSVFTLRLPLDQQESVQKAP